MTRLLLALLLAAPSAFAFDTTGGVFGVDGSPIEGARVVAHLPEATETRTARLRAREPRPTLASAETSADGSFALEKLPDLVIDLAIEAKGFAPHVLRTFPGDIALTAILQPAEMSREPVAEPRAEMVPDGSVQTGSGVIEGTVSLDGEPFPGAPVVIQPQANHYVPPIQVVADAKGAFRASGLLPMRYAVFSGEGLDPRVRRLYETTGDIEPDAFSTIDLRNEMRARVTVALQRAPMITGRIVDHENQPVTRAQVQVVPAGQPAMFFTTDFAARTGSDGRYTITAPDFEAEMRAQIVVHPPGASHVRSEEFAVSGNRVVDVRLPRFEVVPVQVVDDSGAPVPNALVAFVSADDQARMRDVTMLVREPFAARASRTGADGIATLQLVAGSYAFAAIADGFQAAAVMDSEVRRGSAITLQLAHEQLIRGRVHRGDEGVAGARVAIVGGTMPRQDRGEMTAADGSFELNGLARGTYRVMIMKPEELISHAADVEAPGTFDLDLPPAGTLVVEAIDAATGGPVPEFGWAVEPLDIPPDENRSSRRNEMRHLERQSGGSSNGSVRIRASAAAYRVSAGATGFAPSEPREVRLRAGEESRVTFQLGRGSGVSGRVMDERGVAVEGAAVFAVTAEGSDSARLHVRIAPAHAQTAADGTYTLTGLAAGEVTISARKEGYVPLRKVVSVDGITTLDLTLSRGLSIEGVVMRNGKPVADANIGAMTAAMGGDHQPAITDTDGRFTIHGLVPGRYTISAFADGFHKELHGVDPSQQRRVTISLDPEVQGVVYGTVRGIHANADGKITRRIVFVQGPDGGAEGAIDDAGNYRIEDAPTGEAFVTASIETDTSSRTSSRVPVRLEAGVPSRVDLDLAGNVVVRGRATYDGSPLSGARIVFGSPGYTFSSTTTSADGVYEIALPAPGVYQINAHSERLRSTYYLSVREIEGDTTIDIDVRDLALDGDVVDAVTRQPIRGALVSLSSPLAAGEMFSGQSATGIDGHFTVAASAAGRYNLVISAPGYAHTVRQVTLDNASTPPVVVELTPAEPLRVRIVDARTGTPLEGHLAIETKDGMAIPAHSGRSIDALELRFSLAPGTYRVTATVQGYGEKTVEATAPGIVEIRM